MNATTQRSAATRISFRHRLWVHAAFLCFWLASTVIASSASDDPIIWYDEPAAEWLEAQPLGNGRLGAMMFGGTDKTKIQLNEESLWSGQPLDCNPKAALQHLDKIRQLLFQGRNQKAMRLSQNYLLGDPPRVRSHQSLGNLNLRFGGTHEVSRYRRQLDLKNGVWQMTYHRNGVRFMREAFISAVDDVLVLRLSAGKAGQIDAKIGLTRRQDAEVRASGNNELLLKGQVTDKPDPERGPGGENMRFAARVRLLQKGGKLQSGDKAIAVSEADSVTLFLTAATDYSPEQMRFDRDKSPAAICRDIVKEASQKSYSRLRRDHIREHRSWMKRVKLKLGEPAFPKLPTDERLEKVKEGAHDPGLVRDYFQFGRYLLISCSRDPGRLPANLQGIWNRHMNAPWGADYHTNINLQMNYWPAAACNLPETSRCLIEFIDRLRRPGRKTAQTMYGADGWTMHHLTDVFGKTCVHDGIRWGMLPMGGPWMCLPLWRYFEHTGDRQALKETIYPVMKGAAKFVMGFLVEGPEGHLVTAPSYSPENAFINPETGEPQQLTYAPTMDIEIIHALLERTIAAARVLERDEAFRQDLRATMERLPDIQVGQDGTIQEWIKDYKEAEPGHRHVSHLLGLHPGDSITPETPELFEAARKTLQRRLEHGSAGVGWSNAWTISLFARLQDGESAYQYVMALLRENTAANLFDLVWESRPPFQIDGNFGGTAGIAEMLLQSHRGKPGRRVIDVLPALPPAWSKGSVEGLLARGGFRVDIQWQDQIPRQIQVHSLAGNTCRLHWGDRIEFDTNAGETYIVSGIARDSLRHADITVAN